eukprot:gene7326-9984_t
MEDRYILLFILYSIFALGCSLTLVEENSYQSLSTLLKSNARNDFDSDATYFKSITEFSHDILRPSYLHKNKPHSYFLSLNDDYCSDNAGICHDTLKDHFGEPKYTSVDESHSIVVAAHNQIEKFKLKHPELLIYFIPMTPQSKISNEIKDLNKELTNNEKMERVNNQSGKLIMRLIVGAMSDPFELVGLEEFINELLHSKEYIFDVDYVNTKAIPHMNTRNYIMLDNIPSVLQFVNLAKIFSTRHEIQWIERQLPFHTHNRWVRGVCDSGDHRYENMNHYNLSGSGEYIGISDTGIDMKSCYFHDEDNDPPYTSTNLNHRKVVRYFHTTGDIYDGGSTTHGTHVSGIAAGAPYRNYGDYKKYAGVAYDAKIVFFDIGKDNKTYDKLYPPSDLNSGMFQLMYNVGARIFTNSWGTSSSSSSSSCNTYSSNSYQVDSFMYSYPDAVVIFSAGNNGNSGASTVCAPGTCKNCITIGASMNDNEAWLAYSGTHSNGDVYTINSVASFSAQGPTSDNRMKPDVLAPGWWVTSAKGQFNASETHCDLKALQGTSQSAPAAAGSVAKIRQYFREGYYPGGIKNSSNGFTPSGSLLKAMLVHSAQPMTYKVTSTGSYSTLSSSSYPSNTQGYGRIQIDTVLNFANSTLRPISLFVIGSSDSTSSYYRDVKKGTNRTHVFTTSSSSSLSAIRITMAYTDYIPSSYSSGSTSAAMQNIVKVTVSAVTSSGAKTSYDPYLISGAVVSNVQVIDIDNPTASTTYTVKVYATKMITTAAQPYALVITGNITTLPDTENYVYKRSTNGKYDLSDGATVGIIVLVLLVVGMGLLVYGIRRISEKESSVLIDPLNYEYDDSVYEVRDVQGRRRTIGHGR